MQTFVLQDWILVRSAGNLDYPQEAKDWLALSSFQDVVFWLDVSRFSVSAGTLEFRLQTSPTKDESLFKTMVSSVSPGTGIKQLRVILATNPAVPLATWVRWSLNTVGTSGGAWDIAFRVFACANRVASPMRA